MFKFFRRVYEDEIAYSIFARYGVLSGNPGFRHTSNELFGIKDKNHCIYYPMCLDNFINQLPVEMGFLPKILLKRIQSFLFLNLL